MDNESKNRIDKLLATFFFGCNIPFLTVESEHFKAFLQALNPHYSPPTRKTLASSILNNQYNELVDSIVKDEPQNGVLLIDGWKNSTANTKNVVSAVSLATGQHLFLDSWNFSSSKETGEALSEVVNSCIDIARTKYNINIYAVVTDNASNMKSMGRIVNIWHTTCNSHSGNLLFKSLGRDAFDQQIDVVIKEFRSPYLQSELLSRGGRKMILAGDTRWCSRRDAYRRCVQNLPVMREIILDNLNKAPEDQYSFKVEVVNLLQDQMLEMNFINALVFYDPVCSLINSCQKKNYSIANATEKWLSLEFPVNNPEVELLLNNRLTTVINPYGLAANFLHPRYRGRRFENNQNYMRMMNEFFENELTENGLRDLQNYIEGNGLFRILFERNYQSAAVFWKAAKIFYPELSLLAEKLINLPASTGELERLFSQWAYVHSVKRNRLRADRSAKLIALYYSLKLGENFWINNIDSDDDEDDNVNNC